MVVMLRAFKSPAWQKFLEGCPTQTFQKGELMLLKDAEPEVVYVVKAGVVKVYDITSAGDEQPVSFDTKHEIFPIAWALRQSEKTEYFYQALNKVTVYKVPRAGFERFLQAHPRTTLELYANLANHIASLQQRIHGVQQPKATDKILYTLMYMADRFGLKVNPVTSRLKIPITQQELALFIGLTRETTSMELKKLEQDKVISYSRSHFSINTKRLKKLIES